MIRTFKNNWPVLLLICAGWSQTNPVWAQNNHRSLRKGDSEYDAQRYKNAEKYYRDAADLQYGDPEALYNLGNSLYQQGDWEDAATRFEQAANSFDLPAAKANALHNLGNALLKQHQYQKAVDAYENSLRLRPGDSQTKQNLQMAKKKLKEAQKQQQKQEKQSDQQQQPQQDNPSPKDQQQQPQQPQQNPGEQPQTQESPQQKQQQSDKPEQIKKEDARRLLETAIGPEDQKNTRKYREQRRQPPQKENKKDW
jgi:tetratricopeptide (TPR) repeat protein